MTAPSHDGHVRRGGLDVHYVEWPAEGTPVAPSVLMLHGLGSNARYWDRVAGHLNARRRVALDLTPVDAEHAGMAELVASIAFAILELDLARPVVAGHSWGAAMGLELVVSHPELVSGFVFVDGPIFGMARAFTWDEVQAMMQPPFRHYASPAEAFAESRGYLGQAWGDDLEPFVEAGLTRDDAGFVSRLTAPVRLRILRDLHDTDPESLWRRVSVPAEILIARKHDERIARSTEQGVARMEEIAPEVAIKRFATPHDIPLYAPVDVAREIETVAATAGARAASA